MKKLIVFLAAMWALGAWAGVTEVRMFEATPGHGADLMKAAVEARAIQQKLGATPFIGTDQMGRMHYVLQFPDWAAWAVFEDKLRASKDWAAFLAKYDLPQPISKQLAVSYLNSPVVAKTMPVTLVTAFKVNPGKTEAFVAEGQEYVALHTKLGASPGISIDPLGNVVYVLAFDSFASEAKFLAASQASKEQAALDKKTNENPMGQAVDFYLVEQYTGP